MPFNPGEQGAVKAGVDARLPRQTIFSGHGDPLRTMTQHAPGDLECGPLILQVVQKILAAVHNLAKKFSFDMAEREADQGNVRA